MSKKAKVVIHETGSDAWLKEFQAALKCSTFKYKPHAEQCIPHGFKGKKYQNILIAQSYQANFQDSFNFETTVRVKNED